MKAKTITGRLAAVLLAFAVAFTAFPLASGQFESHAASYWKNVKAKSTASTVTLSWSKLTKTQQRKITGIAVYRDGKIIKRLSKTAKYYTNKNLDAGRAYTYQLKTYKKSYKTVRMYYNKNTAEWQTKKIAGARSKKVKKASYRYSNASVRKKVKTDIDESLYPKPSNLKTSVDGKTVNVTWDPIETADGYYVYVDGEEIDFFDEPNCSFDGVEGAEYVVTVSAVYGDVESKKAKVTVKITKESTDPEQPTTVTITDYKGKKRTVKVGDPKIKNPLYNRDVDGTFNSSGPYTPIGNTVGERYYIQKNGVTIYLDHSYGGYATVLYNGDLDKLSLDMSRECHPYTKWGNELDNPTSEQSLYITGDNGRRLAEVEYNGSKTSKGIRLMETYYDRGSITFTAKYGDEVIDTYTQMLDSNGKMGSDGFSPNLSNAYSIAKTAVSFFENGGSISGRMTQQEYRDLIAQHGEYYARMKAIEQYIWENYVYDDMDCWGGYAVLEAYSVIDYGEYGNWTNPIPDSTGHMAFRPDSYCEAGSFNNPGYNGEKSSYFQANGHH